MKAKSEPIRTAPGKRRLGSILSALLLLLLLPGLSAGTARAQGSTIVIGDGTPESCDIWQTVVALQQAVADIDPGGTISFNCGPDPVTIWIVDVYIQKDLTIDGGGLITFTGGSRGGDGFNVFPGATAVFMNFAFVNGEGACSGPIWNEGTLTLHNILLANNGSNHGCGAGGLYNQGTLTIEDSLITGNAASCDIDDSCGGGGGVGNSGTLHIVNSTISGNWARAQGGGIWNNGMATIENSTISGNTSACQYDGAGGILFCPPGAGIYNAGTMSLINSTVSGNTAGTTDGGSGGGIANDGTLFLQNTTITDNTAESGAGLVNGSAVTLRNSLLAGNHGANQEPSDCSGTLTSQGYNLVGTTTGCTIGGDTTGDLLDVDALLGPLQNNGGPTLTHALFPGSPALDAGNPAAPGSGGTACKATDQRGVPRPVGPRCDIGAVEGEQTAMLPVRIDIKPQDDTNKILLKSRGLLPVAILSTSILDAATADPASVKFGPSGAGAVSNTLKDVNRDGRPDLLLSFRIQQTGLQADDTQACLTGQTRSGSTFQGCDMVSIVLTSSNGGGSTKPPSPGLILWNKLGSSDEVLNSEFGPDLGFYQPGDCHHNSCDELDDLIGNPGYIPGMFGNALTLAPGSYYTYARVHDVVLRSANSSISPEQGAVEMWFQETADLLPYSHGIYRLFDGPWGLGDTLGLWVQAQEMGEPGPARLMFSMGGTCAVTSRADGQPGVAISDYNNTWIHVAAAWDRNGIEGTPERLQLYVDGVVVASESCTNANWSTEFSQSIDIGGGNDGEIAGKFAVDNLKVWNYAKTDYSDRFVEGFKK